MVNREKCITAKNLSAGQVIRGYKEGTRTCFSTRIVRDVNPAYVSVQWENGGDIEKIPANYLFIVDMTEDEFRAEYRKAAEEVCANIQNELEEYEIGQHQMYNAWLSTDAYEMAAECIDGGFRIIGHCRKIDRKITWLNTVLDIGVAIEYEDGEKYWCHWSMEWLNEMLENFNNPWRCSDEDNNI